jgi:hypothetical protein
MDIKYATAMALYNDMLQKTLRNLKELIECYISTC